MPRETSSAYEIGGAYLVQLASGKITRRLYGRVPGTFSSASKEYPNPAKGGRNTKEFAAVSKDAAPIQLADLRFTFASNGQSLPLPRY